MASVFRQTYKRPIPANAQIVTRKGKRIARWNDAQGKMKTAPVSSDGKQVVLTYRPWYFSFRDAEGQRITRKGYLDKEATEEEARKQGLNVARRRSGLEVFDEASANMEFEAAVDAWTDDLRRRGKSSSYV